MSITYDERRICSVIAYWCSHRRGPHAPCGCVDDALHRNAMRKVPFPPADVMRLYPTGAALARNADLANERMGVIRELIAQGKPIPPELDCRLCDLPGIVNPEYQE